MGIFLQAALLPGKKISGMRDMVGEIAADCPKMQLNPEECCFHDYDRGSAILLNDGAAGYEDFARLLSQKTESAVLLLYIYDGDFWGYSFWENDRELDCFSPCPYYFDEGPEREAEYAGNPEVIADYFKIGEDTIRNYYRCWREDDGIPSVSQEEAAFQKEESQGGRDARQVAFDDTAYPEDGCSNGHNACQVDFEDTAYPEDEHCYGDCWQITDFMKKLGFPWEGWKEENFQKEEKSCQTGDMDSPENVPRPAKSKFVPVSQRSVISPGLWFLAPSTLEELPDVFEISYLWDMLKKYPEELFLQFDYERYDEAYDTLTGMLAAQPRNAELYILRAYCCLAHPIPPGRLPVLVSQHPVAMSGQSTIDSGQSPALSGQRPAMSGQSTIASSQSAALSGQHQAVFGQYPVLSGQEAEENRLRLEEQVKIDLDFAFRYAPDNIRLLRMHCQSWNRLRHWSKEPEIPDKRKMKFLDRLIVLDSGYVPGYKLAKAYCYKRMGKSANARFLLEELTHMELPGTVDFTLSFEKIYAQLEPRKNLKAELERDYKTYIREFLKDNPEKKFRQAELCWKGKRAATQGQVLYEKKDLELFLGKKQRR